MTQEQIKYSIESEELHLSFYQKLTHYTIVGFLLIFPFVSLYVQIENHFKEASRQLSLNSFLIFTFGPIFLSFLFYRLQKNRLKFKIIETKLDRETINNAIEKTSKELEWHPFLIDTSIMILKTFPSFWSGSWGEQITILFDGNRILVNSICDPDTISSLTSMGRNKKNLNTLIEEIRKATHLATFN